MRRYVAPTLPKSQFVNGYLCRCTGLNPKAVKTEIHQAGQRYSWQSGLVFRKERVDVQFYSGVGAIDLDDEKTDGPVCS